MCEGRPVERRRRTRRRTRWPPLGLGYTNQHNDKREAAGAAATARTTTTFKTRKKTYPLVQKLKHNLKFESNRKR